MQRIRIVMVVPEKQWMKNQWESQYSEVDKRMGFWVGVLYSNPTFTIY